MLVPRVFPKAESRMNFLFTENYWNYFVPRLCRHEVAVLIELEREKHDAGDDTDVREKLYGLTDRNFFSHLRTCNVLPPMSALSARVQRYR